MLTISAFAVCLDPNDPSKYYYPTLDEEITTSDAIVIGTVTKVKPLREDPSDPEGWTAFIYTFNVTELLRGKVPTELKLRAENDSGGYRMNLDEEHLLFLHKHKEYYYVDSCGKSTELPKGNKLLDQLGSILNK